MDKRSNFFILLAIILVGLIAVPSTRAQNARIKLDLDRTIGEINPMIYGNFVEHLGRHIYGGIWEPGSPLSDDNGFRLDVLEAVKGLNVPILRYPGGNFVSNYHFLDGVGPDRIPRMDLAWDVLEPNTFGTNEFMQFARMIDTEPYFTVNMGTGTIEEAQWWVEYTNIKEGPYYAELRKQHGYPEPWDIIYWSLGNEMDGFWQMGHLDEHDYVKKAREAAKLMKNTDPRIKLVAAGSSNMRPGYDPNEWNRVVMEGLKNVVDYLALHMYVGNPDDNYYNYISTPQVMEQRTDLVRGLINLEMEDADRGDRDPIYIAWDEYNTWYRARRGAAARGRNALEEHYNLEDALVIAGFLNVFIRNADIVKMANMAQLVNVIAPIFTNTEGMYKQTIYFPLELFANNVFGTALDAYVESDTYDTEEFSIGLGEQTTTQKDVPYLDVSAAVQDDGTFTINVMNRHLTDAISTDISIVEAAFGGVIEVYEVNGADTKTQNDFGSQPITTVKKPNLRANGSQFTYSFPAHSFTMLKGRLSR